MNKNQAIDYIYNFIKSSIMHKVHMSKILQVITLVSVFNLWGCGNLPESKNLHLGAGKMEFIRAATEKDASYYLYVPESYVADRVFVAVHGISRNAQEVIKSFRYEAERTGAVLIAPYFEESRFSDFQRLGRLGRGQRADLALIRILADVRKRIDIGAEKIFMYGNSGGGQFVHRFAMAHPDLVRKYAISAPGWFTPPNQSEIFPFGFEATSSLVGLTFNITKFLEIPACVLIGDQDTKRDRTLNKSHRIDALQGRTRFDRARWWVEAVTTAARWRSINTPFELKIIPGVGHDFSEMAAEGSLDCIVFSCLFDSN